jgi:uncharacterized caspase-like protein
MLRCPRRERLKLQDRMHRFLKIALPFLALITVVSLPPAGAALPEKRLALVIGNASYKAKALATPVNDAALIAQTLQAAGFEVTGARDLDQALLRQTFRDFVDSVAKAGPDAVAAVYFAGYGLQLDGENYLVPIDADITDASDVPLRTLRLSEQTHALAALHLKTTFMILDVARASPFVLSGQRLAGGLAWVEPETNMLIAFNAAPGTVSPDVGEGYGPYAKALAEMIREGGLTSANVFDRVRLRVNALTKGAQVPWDASKIETQFMFLERGPGAPPRPDSPERTAWMRSQPMRSLGADDAYSVALMRDTFDAYADFLADYWHDGMTKRIRALLAARREAITWRRTYQANVPEAYWSYSKRYPRGPHMADARRLLTRLGAAIAPPAKFAMMEYDVPSPLPDEMEYVERAVLAFDDPAFALEPPPASPVYFLQPPPAELLALKPPAAPPEAHILPAPTFVSLPAYVDVPAYVVAPPNSFVFNAHKRLAINSSNNVPTNPDDQAVSSSISPPNANSLADSPRLPPSVVTKATLIGSPPPEEIKGPPSPPLPAVSLTPLGPTYSPAALAEIKVTLSLPSPALSLTPPWPTYTPLAWQGIKVTVNPPLPAVSLMSAWPTENNALASPRIAPLALATDSEAPLPVPTMLTPPLRGSITPRTPGAAMPSRETTGSVPLPNPRPVTLARPAIRNRSIPVPQVASTSSPVAVDQAARPTAPVVVRTPNVALGASLPKSQQKRCSVVNEKRICN